MSENMKVSIITATYNDVNNLKRIMKHVLSQNYKNIEYIVVDGGSEDRTLEVLKEAEASFEGKMKWISEPDRGIFDAINKGCLLATGDIIGCCFDEFADTRVLNKIVHTIETEGTDGVHGDLLYVDGERIIRKWKQGQGTIRTGWMPGHPTLYLKRKVYEAYGYYKPEYKVSADYEYMVRILKDQEVKLSYIPQVLIKMSYGGTSTGSLKAYIRSFLEGHRALKENGISFAFVTDILRTARVLVQFVKK